MNKRSQIWIGIIGGCVGAALTMIVGLFTPLGIEAQSDNEKAIFRTIQCEGLTVVDKNGSPLLELKNNVIGGEVRFYNLSGQVMMNLSASHNNSEINLFNKTFGSKPENDNETPVLGIEMDAGPLSNWLQVGNRATTGGVFIHNTDGFSELNVYHRNGQGGLMLFSSDNMHSLSIYDSDYGKDVGLSAKKVIGLGSYRLGPEMVLYDKHGREVVLLNADGIN